MMHGQQNVKYGMVSTFLHVS